MFLAHFGRPECRQHAWGDKLYSALLPCLWTPKQGTVALIQWSLPQSTHPNSTCSRHSTLAMCQECCKAFQHALFNSISTMTLQDGCNYSCFTGEKTDTQRRKVTNSRSHHPGWGCDISRGEGQLTEELVQGHLERSKRDYKCGIVESWFPSRAKGPPEKWKSTEDQVKDWGNEMWY